MTDTKQDGVVVPRKATPAMYDAWSIAEYESGGNFDACYAAMIAAAQDAGGPEPKHQTPENTADPVPPAPRWHEHERGAPLMADCDGWCRAKYKEWEQKEKTGNRGGACKPAPDEYAPVPHDERKMLLARIEADQRRIAEANERCEDKLARMDSARAAAELRAAKAERALAELRSRSD